MDSADTVPFDRERAMVREGRRRLIWLCLSLWIGIQGIFGLAWDIQWHAAIGRDRFWTPPHTAMYVAVALGGLLSLYIVLTTTWRYRHGDPAINDLTTSRFFGFFHAPAGF